MKRTLLFLFTIINFITAFSQHYPVRADLYIVPPYTVYLSDYYAPASNIMYANILLTDISQDQVQVKFKVSIIGDKLKLTSKPAIPVAPVTLTGGELQRIGGYELAQYFLPKNLNIEGSGATNFIQTGKLPEGYYIFTLEVVEYYRNVVISNQAVSFAWVMLNEPPQWISPANNMVLSASQPQNVFFSWLPMHMGSPNAVQSTQYEFKLCKMPDTGADPNVVIASTDPIYTENLSQTVLIYGADKPALDIGALYVCQIKAEDIDGRDVFKNNGLSKPVVFKYGTICKTPIALTLGDVHKTIADFSWTPSSNNSSFELHLRQNDDNGMSEWYSYEAKENNYTVKQLQPDTKYEYKLKAICGDEFSGNFSKFTTVKTFKTEPAGNADYNCNDIVDIPDITDNTVYKYLHVGDMIKVGGFVAKITRIDKSENNTFSGLCETGFAVWGVAIYCKFTNITINRNHDLLSGTIKALRTEEVNWVGGGGDGSGNGSGNSDDNGNGDGYNELDNFSPDSVYITDVVIDSVIIDSLGDTKIYADDDVIIIHKDDNLQIEDGGNNIYVVEEGKVYKNPPGVKKSNGEQGNTEYEKLILVNFDSNPNTRQYGYDKRDNKIPAFDPQYELIQIHRKNYYTDWASVENNKSCNIQAYIRLMSDSAKYTDLKFFIDGNRFTPSAETGDSVYNIVVNNPSSKDEQTIEAAYTVTDVNGKTKNVKAGQLKVKSYDKQPFNVCIVSVNGVTYPYGIQSLQMELNKIFKQAVAEVTLSTLSISGVEWDINSNNKLSDSHSGAVSNYNQEMKAVKRAMRQNDNYDRNTYYLFMMPESDNPELKGYMPLKRQYGFIFVNASGNNTQAKITQTIAHELSHGVFRLRHTFSPHNMYIAPKGKTHNLMDYTTNTTATNLRKYQWDYIHNPENIVGIFEDDSEGEMKSGDDLVTDILGKLRCAYNSRRDKIFIGSNEEKIVGVNLKPEFSAVIYLPNRKEKYAVYEIASTFSKIETSTYYRYNFGDNLQIQIKKEDADVFENYIKNDDFTTEYNTISQLIQQDKSSEAIDVLYNYSYCVYELLNSKDRKFMFKALAEKYILSENYEDMVLNLIRTSYNKADDITVQKRILYYVLQKPISPTILSTIRGRKPKTIYESFLASIDNTNGKDNYYLFIQELSKLYNRVYSTELQNDNNVSLYFDWNKISNARLNYYDGYLDISNLVLHGYYRNIIAPNSNKIRHNSIVMVHFSEDLPLYKYTGERYIIMPAFALNYLIDIRAKQLDIAFYNTVFNLFAISKAYSGFAFLSDASALQKAKIFWNALSSTMNAALENDNIRISIDKIGKDSNKAGQRFLDIWETYQQLMIGKGAAESITNIFNNKTFSMFTDLCTTWDIIKSTPEIEQLNERDEIENEINNLKKLFTDEGIVY